MCTNIPVRIVLLNSFSLWVVYYLGTAAIIGFSMIHTLTNFITFRGDPIGKCVYRSNFNILYYKDSTVQRSYGQGDQLAL
jgi:hypothetical protein